MKAKLLKELKQQLCNAIAIGDIARTFYIKEAIKALK